MSEFFGKFKSFDDETNTVVFELSFVDEFTIKDIEDLVKESKYHPIVVKKGKPKEPPKNKHYRKWFVNLTTIIKHFKKEANEPPVATQKEKDVMHISIKNRLLPVQRIKIGSLEELLPPSLTTLSVDEFEEAIIRMEEIYSDLGVDFKYRYEKKDD